MLEARIEFLLADKRAGVLHGETQAKNLPAGTWAQYTVREGAWQTTGYLESAQPEEAAGYALLSRVLIRCKDELLAHLGRAPVGALEIFVSPDTSSKKTGTEALSTIKFKRLLNGLVLMQAEGAMPGLVGAPARTFVRFPSLADY